MVNEVCCYHCGEQVPSGTNFFATIAGQPQPMCCPGCAAVAELIDNSGMGAFYQQRTAFSERPDNDSTDVDSGYKLYDDPDIFQQFARTEDTGQLSASLLLGGVTCAACTWLIEQSLTRCPGIHHASVNLAQSRLDVSIDPQQILLSDVFAQVESLGYRARPFQSSTLREQLQQERKTQLRQLAVAGLGMMQVGMFAISLHAGDIQGIDSQYQTLLRLVSLLISAIVVLYSARPFFVTAWRNLKQNTLVMDLPVALAIGLAWLASFWATLSDSGDVYFDSVVMFTFFLLLGRYLERSLREREAMIWIDAEASLPLMVKVWRKDHWEPTARQQLTQGERILVANGDTLPVDGEVAVGSSAVDESTFSGEHLPRQVSPGDKVFAGTINREASLEITVSGSYMETRLAALQQSIDSGQREKPALARLADRIASWFVAGVLLATAITALYWWHSAPDKALWIALSVLVISCPCALALATPAALTSAAMTLRRQGIIVRGENALEAASRATHLLMDKTGTLTTGQFSIQRIVCLSGVSEEKVLGIASALQMFSSHPIARAFTSIQPVAGMEAVKYHIGSGLQGYLNQQQWRLGSTEFCRQAVPHLPPAPDSHFYWIALCCDQQPIAWIALDDAVRPEAQALIKHAHQLGLALELITGDSSARGPALAEQLGIPTVHKGMTPQQKMARVKTLQDQGAVVVMAGDGLNDAPVLALADVSFAVAGATDLARSQADLVIVDNPLGSISFSLDIARDCRDILTQNMWWALSYNLCGIPLAAVGLIPPWAAALGMSASSLLVVLNSLRLKRRINTH